MNKDKTKKIIEKIKQRDKLLFEILEELDDESDGYFKDDELLEKIRSEIEGLDKLTPPILQEKYDIGYARATHLCSLIDKK